MSRLVLAFALLQSWTLLFGVQHVATTLAFVAVVPPEVGHYGSRRHILTTTTAQSPMINSGACASTTTTTQLYAQFGGGVRQLLGKGPNAIVRNGVVLVAPAEEYHHFYRQAAIFIYTMGELDDEEAGDDDGTFVIRGVILDHPTPFRLAEMTPALQNSEPENANPLGNNLVFRGGNKGGEGVILLHNQEALGQSPIGESGIFQGGWDSALAACAQGQVTPDNFKVFFNYCEFTEQELEDMLNVVDDDDGDAWASVEVDPSFVLNGDYMRGDAWARLRNIIKQTEMSESTKTV